MPESPANNLPAFAIGPLRNAARIDDANVRRIIDSYNLVPPMLKLTGDGRRFGKIQLAAESMEGYFSHRYEKELPDMCGQLSS
jgi:hypothetical protein